jgi:dCMP deaminase
MNRPDHDLYFLAIVQAVALRASCIRRSVGCVITDDYHHIMSTGYNGPHSKSEECQNGVCAREQSKSGEGLDACCAIHAEQNALLQCGNTMSINTCYVSASPCITCVKLLMNTSCKRVVFLENYPHIKAKEIWEKAGREWVQYVPNPRVMVILAGIEDIRKYYLTS